MSTDSGLVVTLARQNTRELQAAVIEGKDEHLLYLLQRRIDVNIPHTDEVRISFLAAAVCSRPPVCDRSLDA